jgi:putative oxidoreductase
MGAISTGNWPYRYTAIMEIAVGPLVVFARLAALTGSGEMTFAYCTERQSQSLWHVQNGGGLEVLFCCSFLRIALAGTGSFALIEKRHS